MYTVLADDTGVERVITGILLLQEGEVEEVSFLQGTTNYVIPAGKTITGYVGSQLLFPRDMGCEMQHPNLPTWRPIAAVR